MIDFLLKAVHFVVVIGVLIFIHELGHFLLARFFGMGVRVFSLGFGPKLLAFRAGQTEYRVCAVPLGGYVQLVAQDSEDDDTTEGFPPDTWFVRRPSWQRMLVVAAGPLFNLVLAWALYAGLYYANGRFETPASVGEVVQAGAAERAGIKQGDVVTAVDGAPILYFRELREKVEQSGGKPLRLDVKRGQEQLAFTVTPDLRPQKNLFGEDVSKPLLGVTSTKESVNIPMGAASALREGLAQTWEITAVTGQIFWKLVAGVVPVSTIGGPIMIAELVGKQSEQGLAHLVSLTAMISVNLAILNLLPIPVLDGGHILFFALETVLRRPVPERLRAMTTKAGFVLLMGLMLMATANDILRLIGGGSK
ncbi:Metalloprotease MmpA [Fundidesulfovibrio magnetotacticus]|uniref:Zinc metalloprotease n=1 Tax=Fundidesulfovibrio magnetotacticus TaxID=2730080 RepID=A0A6V8LX78_9BACT|nr:RIP metalloprotease RseP [Fundidesulfovibrio magnetotacticus]GFK92885.1 Metalloprotease MmpA [Fundidesulfovibrio magnetotacticus]